MYVRSFAVSLITVTALISGAPAAGAWEPAGGAVFNNPQGGHAATWRIIDHVEDAIRHTPAGARILISSYLMDQASSVNALIAARARGVRVQVVLDGDQGNTVESRRLGVILNADNGLPGSPNRWGRDKSFLVFCTGSCRGDRTIPNNHTKFYMFSRTGTARYVVMVSSANLNRGGAERGWNDLYTIKGMPGVFADFSGIHREMAQDTPLDGDRFRQFTRGRYTYRFYPLTAARDPVLEDLAKVRCRGATGGSGHNGRTAINISMFAWGAERGGRIAERVVELDRQGCDVSVIYGAPYRNVSDILKRSARRGGIKLWDSRHDFDRDGSPDLRTHEKYMLINGRYGGDSSSWQVHTGCMNWAMGIKSGDDLTLNIASRAAYQQYLTNWRYIARYGSRRVR